MKEDNLEEMSFWDHLEELRSTLIKIGGVLVVFAIVFFIFMPDIFDKVILAPCKGDFVLYQLFEDIKMLEIPNVNMDILSMGMSHDYQVAIEEGANMIRVGSSIFATA